MCGSGVLTLLHLIRVGRKRIPSVVLQHPIINVVFAAVRGATTIRSTSGALTVIGSTQIRGSSTSAFVFPQDLVRILFSGAAFSGPFAGSGLFPFGVRCLSALSAPSVVVFSTEKIAFPPAAAHEKFGRESYASSGWIMRQ